MSLTNKVQLITYVDRLSAGGFAEFGQLLNSHFLNLFGGVHLLPFYEKIDGEDAGYDPVDHSCVDSRLGVWSDVRSLSASHEVMVDLIVNHMSSDSSQFLDYQQKGEDSEFEGLFLRYRDIFPDGSSDQDIQNIYRPRPTSPFTSMSITHQDKELFWTTFSSKQIDINVFHLQGKDYIEGLIELFAKNGML